MVLFETIITVPSLAPCLWALWTLCSTGWARISKRNNNSYTFVPEECEQQNIHLKKTVAGDYAYVVFPLLNTLLQLGLACTTATLTYEEAYENAHWSTSFWATALWALSWVFMLASLAIQSNPKSHHLSFHLLTAIGLVGNWYTLYQTNQSKSVIGGLVSAQLSLMLLLLTFQGLIALFQPAENLNAPHLGRRSSKETKASWLSKCTFYWLNDLIYLGNKRPLEEEDLWELMEEDQSASASQKFAEYRSMDSKGSIAWTLLRVIRPLFVTQLSCAVCASVLGFSGPFFLYRIVGYIESPKETSGPYYGALLLFGMLSAAILKAVIDGRMYFLGRRSGIRVRSILINEIYTKALKRAASTSGSSGEDDGEPASLGKIVTLMSVDTNRVLEFNCYAHQLLVCTPLSTIIAIGSLFAVLGWSAVSSIILLLITSPLGGYIGKAISRIQEELMGNTDKRVSIMNEILQGVRIIKYFAWEKHFMEKVNAAREKELKSIVKLWGAYIAFGTIGYGGGLVIAFVTFLTYTVVFGHTLDAATAFTAINLLHVVSGLLSFLPHEIMQIYKAKVALERILAFLAEEELEKYLIEGPEKDLKEKSSYSSLDTLIQEAQDSFTVIDDDGTTIGFKGASFAYHGEKQNAVEKQDSTASTDETLSAASEGDVLRFQSGFLLNNMDVEFPIGGLSLVCGPTGSGKTSIILALLGEMKRIQGQHYLPDSRFAEYDYETGLNNGVAYAAQNAWLLNATIRDNILFGEPYDETRYQRVIQACALVRDLTTLEGGDLTEIGEKGVNVSGGQKQRISLARACYSRAKFVLLDDPLSAVDAPTAKFLVDHAIRTLLKRRTCILVSHAVQLVLPFADYVVSIKNGDILAQGHPHDISKNPRAEGIFGLEIKTEEEPAPFDHDLSVHGPLILPQSAGTKLVNDEERATGSVRLDVYRTYFKAAGGIFFALVFFLSFFVGSTIQFGNDWWLKTWTDSNAHAAAVVPQMYNMSLPTINMKLFYGGSNGLETKTQLPSLSFYQIPQENETVTYPDDSRILSPPHPDSTFFYISIYGLFGVAIITASNLQTLVILFGSLIASRRLHNSLLGSILGAPLRFFEVTPIGRVLNRFSKDVENVDNVVMESIYAFVQKVIQGATILVVISSVTPPFLLAIGPIIFLYVWIAQLYLKTSRELKRLDAVSRSPIYAQFSETLTGVTTIRAFGSETRFLKLNEEKVDSNHRAFFYLWTANRWLCFRTDIISAFVVTLAGVGVMTGQLGAGWAGLTMTYALDFTQALLWTVRMHAEMEMSLNSVERVNEYTSIEQEPPMHIASTEPSPNWPNEGSIKVSDLHIRYAVDQPDVLKGVNFQARPHEKIGVVGRTGAGKSTLSLAFFRIIPLSGGSITIDGIDISTLGLGDLRSRLTIIPQDPILFSGSLRSNLDPLSEHEDASLWQALKRVRLLDSMQLNEDGESSMSLESSVSAGGSNFSQGQRQLLCLARALLRRNRIIFLDEATASVDNATDARIQETIRQEFVGSTILCIAHRLRTVIDYDRILVLDNGQVAEFGSPLELIERSPAGIFRKMVEETGEFEELLELARIASSKDNDGASDDLISW